MDRTEGIDAPDPDAMAAFAGRASEGPVYMLNLLEFLPDGGAERYAEYGTAVAPLLEKAGGKPVFAGRPAEQLIGDGSWDMVLVVSYPTRQAFIDMEQMVELRTQLPDIRDSADAHDLPPPSGHTCVES